MSTWNHLPTELHLSIVRFLIPQHTTALSQTSRAFYSLLLPHIFAIISIESPTALSSFILHVPPTYGALIKRLLIRTIPDDDDDDETLTFTQNLATLLRTCSSLSSLSLSLVRSINHSIIAPVFPTLTSVHHFEIASCAQQESAPLSERIAVSLAASLPSLTHLTLSRLTRSAFHVDTCPPPGVPLVLNDHDVPPHSLLGSHLSIPNLLKLPNLKSLDLRDLWIDCDENMSAQGKNARLDHLSISGSMYSDGELESKACLAWLRACGPTLRSFKSGIPLGESPPYSCLRKDSMSTQDQSTISPLPILAEFHVDAERVSLDALFPMLNVLSASDIKRITIVNATMCAASDQFTRECAYDEFDEWQAGIEFFLRTRSEEWSSLERVELNFGQGTQRFWNL